MDIITMLFGAVALVCGFLTLFWMLKVKYQIEQMTSKTYLVSAIIAVSFLFSFPLWSMFIDVFDFVSPDIRKISYLFFSAGYFGVLLVSYLAVSEITGMKEYINGLNKEVKKQTKKTKLYKDIALEAAEKPKADAFVKKVRQLEKTHEDFEKLKADKEAEMNSLKQEIEQLRNSH